MVATPQPTFKTVLGFGKEAVLGTAVAATDYMPIKSFTPKDNLGFILDEAWRGSAVKSYGHVPGAIHGTVDFGGPVYADTIGYELSGLLGDVLVTGTTTAPTGTLSALSVVGATSVSSSVSIANGTVIQIDVGVLAEIVTTSGVPTGAGPYTIPVPALTKPHASGVAITAIAVPYTTQLNLLNSGNTQPPSWTLTESTALNALQFAGCKFSEIGFKFDGGSMFEHTAKAVGFASVIGSQPVPSYSSVRLQAGWEGVVKIGGATVGGVMSGEVNIKRGVEVVNTVDGTQQPYTIWSGEAEVDGKLVLLMEADTYRAQYVAGTAAAIDVNFSQGSGAGATSVILHCNSATLTNADHSFGKSYIELDCSFEGDANTTDVGYSGGYSPISASIKNAKPVGTYK